MYNNGSYFKVDMTVTILRSTVTTIVLVDIVFWLIWENTANTKVCDEWLTIVPSLGDLDLNDQKRTGDGPRRSWSIYIWFFQLDSFEVQKVIGAIEMTHFGAHIRLKDRQTSGMIT